MYRARPINLQDMEIVRLSRLPIGQAGKLLKWLPAGSIFNVRTQAGVFDDCVSYHDYLSWYEEFHQKNESVNFSF